MFEVVKDIENVEAGESLEEFKDRKSNTQVDEFEGFTPLEIPWHLFKTKWVSDLKARNMMAGVNWTGSKIECQEEPDNLIEAVESFDVNIT